MNIQFENALYLWSLLLLPLILLSHFFLLKYKKQRAMRFANFDTLKRMENHWLYSKKILQLFLRMAFVLLIITAFSSPFISYKSQGIAYNVVFGLDISGSMLANDLAPTRLAAAAESLRDKLDTLPGGSLTALVTFGGLAFIESGLTDDKEIVISSLEGMQRSTIPGTAIGDAIKTSANLLMTVDNSNPDVIVLLTDGQENILTQEELMSVVDFVKKQGITINIVGIGSLEGAASGMIEEDQSRFILNDKSLQQIAEETEGKYLGATTRQDISDALDIFLSQQEITKTFRLSPILFALAIILLFTEWTLTQFHFRVFP